MPYIDGADLATVLKKTGKLPVPTALRIARDIASGLVAAHDAGVVHRDLKPANIMVDAEDEAIIMDFGIARSSPRRPNPAAVGDIEGYPTARSRPRCCRQPPRCVAPSSAPSITWRRSRRGARRSISAPTSTRSA